MCISNTSCVIQNEGKVSTGGFHVRNTSYEIRRGHGERSVSTGTGKSDLVCAGVDIHQNGNPLFDGAIQGLTHSRQYY